MFKKLFLTALVALAALSLGGHHGATQARPAPVFDDRGLREMAPGEVMPGYTEEEYRLYRSTGEEWGDKGAPEPHSVLKPATKKDASQ